MHASSRRQFTCMMEIAQRETEETLYWLELIREAEVVKADKLTNLEQECRELLAILTASIRTAKRRATKPSDD